MRQCWQNKRLNTLTGTMQEHHFTFCQKTRQNKKLGGNQQNMSHFQWLFIPKAPCTLLVKLNKSHKNNHVCHKNPNSKNWAHAPHSLAPVRVQGWHSGFLFEGYCITFHTNVENKSIFFFSLKAWVKHFHCAMQNVFWKQSTFKSSKFSNFFDIASLKMRKSMTINSSTSVLLI